MKINLKVVFLIIAVSSLIGFTYNYLTPGGIPLIAVEKSLQWADDTILNFESAEVIKKSENLNIIKDEKSVAEKENSPETNIEEKIRINDEPESKSEPEFTEPVAINLSQAYNLFNRNILFIDAREPADYNYAHIKNAINIPFDYLDEHKHKLEQFDKNQPLVIYCAGTDCDLSILLGNILFEQGFNKTYIFFGGWNEWTEADYPIEEAE